MNSLLGLFTLLGGMSGTLGLGIVIFAVLLTLLMAVAIAVPIGTVLGYGSAYLVERKYGYDGIVVWAMVVYSICIGVAAAFIGVTLIGSFSALAAPVGLAIYIRYRNEGLAFGFIAAGGLWYVGTVVYLWWIGFMAAIA